MSEFKKVPKPRVDHTKLRPGLYLYKHDHVATTYDLRFVRPNYRSCISPQALHTLEHLGNLYLENQRSPQIHAICFAPMGCRTGFYLVVAGWQNPLRKESPVFAAVKNMLKFIIDYENEIPDATPEKCGNWREHNLPEAKSWAAKYLHDLQHKPHFEYPLLENEVMGV